MDWTYLYQRTVLVHRGVPVDKLFCGKGAELQRDIDTCILFACPVPSSTLFHGAGAGWGWHSGYCRWHRLLATRKSCNAVIETSGKSGAIILQSGIPVVKLILCKVVEPIDYRCAGISLNRELACQLLGEEKQRKKQYLICLVIILAVLGKSTLGRRRHPSGCVSGEYRRCVIRRFRHCGGTNIRWVVGERGI